MRKWSLLLMVLGALVAQQAVADDDESVGQKAGKGVKQGGDAAGRGVEKGVDAAGKGIKKGAEATGRGLQKAGEWLQKKVGKDDKK